MTRAFLGWLRGEPKHCQMAAIPKLEEEDARLPGRERDTLVKERTRIINRIKSLLIRFGVRGFNAGLRNAAAKLKALRLPEKAGRCHPTRWPRSSASWRGSPRCAGRSGRSRRNGWPK